MIRILALTICLLPSVAFAQSSHQHGGDADGRATSNAQKMQAHHMPQRADGLAPTQPGQSAFAAIQEIVEILEAEPKTDWSKVNTDALRQHLVDMNNVTLAADVKSEPLGGGIRFVVSGAGAVRDSIRRMILAHATTMNGVDGWKFEATETEGGATLVVRPAAKDANKLKALGFFGILTRGMHHQEHHLMIARGGDPHH